MRHRIALFGSGSIGKFISVTTANFSYAGEIKPQKSDLELPKLSDLVNYRKNILSLVDSYKKVQRKYYPEKDMLIKSLKS